MGGFGWWLLIFGAVRPELGVDLVQGDDGVYVRAVVPGTAAARAQLEPGQRLLAIGGEPVPDLASVERVLAALDSTRGLSLVIDDGPLSRGPPPRLRGVARATFLPKSGAARVLSAWLGGAVELRIVNRAWIGLAFGYVPLGRQAFVDGRNVLSLLLSVEYEVPLVAPLLGFGRLILGPELALSGVTSYRVEPLLLGLELGIRAFGLELHAHGGLGPAEGFNFGGGVGYALDLWTPVSSARRF